MAPVSPPRVQSSGGRAEIREDGSAISAAAAGFTLVQEGRREPDGGFEATVVIPTYNRAAVLERAVRTSLEQDGCEIEVLVMDNASDDGSIDRVKRQFPDATLYRAERHHASVVVSRNAAARLARAPVLVSIDDDSVFIAPSTVAEALEEFDSADIGAIGLPYVDFREDLPPSPQQQMGLQEPRAIAVFTGAAGAMRRSAFLEVDGYRESLWRTEEFDLCLRMLDLGYLVLAGSSQPLEHRPIPGRPEEASNRFKALKGLALTIWWDVPMPWMVLDVVLGLAWYTAVAIRHPPPHLGMLFRGFVAGLRMCRLKDRTPVTRATIRLFHALMRPTGLPLEVARQRRLRASPLGGESDERH